MAVHKGIILCYNVDEPTEGGCLMDMKLLPTHLRPLAADLTRYADCLTMTLRCPCGCTCFRLEEAAHSAVEQAAIDEWEAANKAARKGRILRFRKNEDGQTELMCRRIFFGRWEPFKSLIPPPPCYMDVLALRGICRSCGKTHLIYDNRLHGFDALIGEYTGEAMVWQPQWKGIDVPEGALIRVDIPDDAQERMDEMREFIPGFTPEMACDAFEVIEVRSVVDGVPGETLFDAW